MSPETVALLARYNAETNAEVIDVLGNVDPVLLNRDTGSSFTSIMGILNHILLCDVHWLRRLATGVPALWDVSEPVSDLSYESLFEVRFPDLESFAPVRRRIDEALVDLASRLDDAILRSTLKYESSRGPQEKLLAHVLVHIFNHHTHHRGQVSLLLDQFGVANDYSNLIWKV